MRTACFATSRVEPQLESHIALKGWVLSHLLLELLLLPFDFCFILDLVYADVLLDIIGLDRNINHIADVLLRPLLHLLHHALDIF